jgi:hypothetical protein
VSIWRGKRPSDRIMAVLSGRAELSKEDPAIQSVCSKYIFDGATAILGLPTKDERREVLENVPPLIRPHLEREVMRLFRR